MVSNTATTEPWIRRPIYKFGMLIVLAVLAAFHVWMLAGDSTRDASKVGLIVVMMLAVNHIVLVFLQPSQKRRAIPLQVTMIIGGLAYVVVMLWQELGRN